MTGSGKQPRERLLTVLYRAVLWLVAVVALGEVPSASEQAGRSSFRYVAESSFSGLDNNPLGDAGHEICTVSTLDDPDDPPPAHDLAEAGDQSGLVPAALANTLCPKLALGQSLEPALPKRSEVAGTRARGPPASAA